MLDPDWVFEQRIRNVFGKPGRQWTFEEREAVIEWLFEPARFKKLLTSVLNQLHDRGYTFQDIEDAWSQFCDKQIYSVIKTYDPTRPGSADFWGYLRFCFRRSCPRGIRRLNGREMESLDDDATGGTRRRVLDKEEARLFGTGQPTGRSPWKDLDQKRLGERIANCMRRIPSPYREVLILKDVEEHSIAEIASELQKSAGYVKGTLFRARRLFRELFQGEGVPK